MTQNLLHLAADLAVAVLLAFGIYARRHHRRDLAFAYLALNIGVCAAVMSLLTLPQATALGLGLFGVLSIIRLRSDSISQIEVAYYFVALVLGLVNGVPSADWRMVALFDVLLPAILWVADQPGRRPSPEHRTIVLDTVHPHDAALRADLENRLRGTVISLDVSEVDYVREVTVVAVRFRPWPLPVHGVPAGVR